MRIVDLARQLIRLSGHAEEEIEIEFSGLRAGEKLYEELLADADTTVPTRVERLRVARLHDLVGGIESLLSWAGTKPGSSDGEVRERLAAVVIEYERPSDPPRIFPNPSTV